MYEKEPGDYIGVLSDCQTLQYSIMGRVVEIFVRVKVNFVAVLVLLARLARQRQSHVRERLKGRNATRSTVSPCCTAGHHLALADTPQADCSSKAATTPYSRLSDKASDITVTKTALSVFRMYTVRV